jgi:cell division protein FtsQ
MIYDDNFDNDDIKSRDTEPQESGAPDEQSEDAEYDVWHPAPHAEEYEEDSGSEEARSEADEDKLRKEGFREIARKPVKHVRKHYLARLLVTAGVIAAVIIFLASPFFSVTDIEVEGNYYYTDNEVITMAQAETGRNIFSMLADGDIRKRLRKNSYFTKVHLRAKFPSTLVIKVEERDQLAALIYGSSYVVLDSKGSVLRVSREDPRVTLVEGLKIESMNKGSRVVVTDEKKFNRVMTLLKTMREGDFYFKKVDISDVYYKAYITDSLVVSGTYSEIKGALEAGSLQKVVAKLLDNKTKRGTITITSSDNIVFSPDI